MFRYCVLIALAIACVSAQNNGAPSEASGAPEPYSYGYETDSHSAAEQRDQNGQVTGFYTLTDADGRQRRVEYVADESGFRAKVQTNEHGTKSANSADVEVLAAPPTQEQLVYQAPAPQPQYQIQRQQTNFVQQQQQQQQPARIINQQFVQQPLRTATTTTTTGYLQQPYANYGYYPGYGYSGYNSYGVSGSPYGYGYTSNPSGYAYNGIYSSYNNHLPSQYYRSIGQTQSVQPSTYSNSGYFTSTSGSGAAVPVGATNYRTSYQTIGVPASVGYQTVGVQPAGYSSVSSSSSSQRSSGNLAGSSNYIVLKKRSNSEDADSEKNKN